MGRCVEKESRIRDKGFGVRIVVDFRREGRASFFVFTVFRIWVILVRLLGII